MTEEDKRQEYETKAREGVRKIIEASGRISIFIGVLFFGRVIYTTFTDEIFFLGNLVKYLGISLLNITTDFVIALINFSTYGYIGPACTFIFLGYFLQYIGKKVDKKEEDKEKEDTEET